MQAGADRLAREGAALPCAIRGSPGPDDREHVSRQVGPHHCRLARGTGYGAHALRERRGPPPAAARESLITETADLKRLCDRLADEPFVCIDTEFLSGQTFWPKLCLVQIAGPDGQGHAVDTLAELDLDPLYRLLNEAPPIKVFHACRQDVGIFFLARGLVPSPLFDTQVAAMACGYGEAVSYANLVHAVADATISKADRYTDWSRRPLSPAQLAYALADVTHLPAIYRKLAGQLDATDRWEWLDEEMETLTDPDSYRLQPEEAWRRTKLPPLPPRQQLIAQFLAAAREEMARKADRPRRWILSDEALVQIARTAPTSAGELAEIRGVSDTIARGRTGSRMLAAVREGVAAPLPKVEGRPKSRHKSPAAAALLRALLRQVAAEHGIASKLLASTEELDRMAAGDRDMPAFRGWRNQVFGKRAAALCDGRIALGVDGGKLREIPVDDPG